MSALERFRQRPAALCRPELVARDVAQQLQYGCLKLWVFWGDEPELDDEMEEYSFATAAERDAALHMVAEASRARSGVYYRTDQPRRYYGYDTGWLTSEEAARWEAEQHEGA